MDDRPCRVSQVLSLNTCEKAKPLIVPVFSAHHHSRRTINLSPVMVIPEEQPTQPALPIQPEGMRVVCGHCGNTFLVRQPITAAKSLVAVWALAFPRWSTAIFFFFSSPLPNHCNTLAGREPSFSLLCLLKIKFHRSVVAASGRITVTKTKTLCLASLRPLLSTSQWCFLGNVHGRSLTLAHCLPLATGFVGRRGRRLIPATVWPPRRRRSPAKAAGWDGRSAGRQ